MDGTTIAAFAAATAALVAFALAAFMFWKGKWLFIFLTLDIIRNCL